MSNPAANKLRGARFELDLRDWWRERGFDCERLRLEGRLDEGDLVLRRHARAFVIEAKNTEKLNVTGFLREAECERINYQQARGVPDWSTYPLVVHKRRGKGIGDAAVLLTLNDLARLLEDVL